jgi:hypothetical protein
VFGTLDWLLSCSDMPAATCLFLWRVGIPGMVALDNQGCFSEMLPSMPPVKDSYGSCCQMAAVNCNTQGQC